MQAIATQQGRRQMFASLVGVNAISDARRQHGRPLPDGVVAELQAARGLRNGAIADDAQGFGFVHESLNHGSQLSTSVATTVLVRETTLPAMETFGQRLAHAIDLAGIKREKLAADIGISVQAISKVIKGGSSAFSAENAAEAARCLGVDVYWLCTGKGEPHPKPVVDPDELDAREWRQTAREAAKVAGESRVPPNLFLRVVDFMTLNRPPADMSRSEYVRKLMEMIGAA